MAVPGCYVLISDGPVDSVAVAGGTFKVKITPPLCIPRPHDTFAAHLVTANPVKRLLLHVWMIFILYKEMHGIFPESIATADHRVFIGNLIRQLVPMFKFPWHHVGRRIIFQMLHIAAAFKKQGLQPSFT